MPLYRSDPGCGSLKRKTSRQLMRARPAEGSIRRIARNKFFKKVT